MIKNKLVDLGALIVLVGVVLGSIYVYNQIQAHKAFDAAILKILQQSQPAQVK